MTREILPAGTDAPFHRLADAAPALIWQVATDRRCVYVNRSWLQFTGSPFDPTAGFGWLAAVHPDDRGRCLPVLDAALTQGQPFAVEYRLRRQDGEWRWILDRGAPLTDAHGLLAGLVGCGTDIHEDRRARDELARALEAQRQAAHEAELLLGELQHRVRNTVQMIASMLSIQARQATSEETADVLARSAARVRIMGQVQDRLFRRKAPGSVELGSYLVELAQDVAGTAQRQDVGLVAETTPLRVPTGLAAPLGFVVGELVANAMQHAFPGGRGGTIRLALSALPDGMAELALADDGVGLGQGLWPPPARPVGNRIGLTLLAALSRQARASISVDIAGGTRYRLHFPCG